ncbi:MAG: hypothetical protein JNK78_04300 [Planctomycetes bacterium]|nr:hypothetical protein [Planctomycetota bacterium]
MNPRRGPRRSAACALCALSFAFAGCIGSSPPAAPVRWFDATPDAVAGRDPAVPVDVRVEAAAHVGREFLVRTAPRELVVDAQNGWLVDPRSIVAAAVERACGGGSSSGAVLRIEIERFELDVAVAPRVHVRVVVRGDGPSRVVEQVVDAADRTPESMAAAMAIAVARVAEDVASKLAPVETR